MTCRRADSCLEAARRFTADVERAAARARTAAPAVEVTDRVRGAQVSFRRGRAVLDVSPRLLTLSAEAQQLTAAHEVAHLALRHVRPGGRARPVAAFITSCIAVTGTVASYVARHPEHFAPAAIVALFLSAVAVVVAAAHEHAVIRRQEAAADRYADHVLGRAVTAESAGELATLYPDQARGSRWLRSHPSWADRVEAARTRRS